MCLDPEEVAHAAYRHNVSCDERPDLGAYAPDVDINGARTTAVLETPDPVQQRLTRVRPRGMRRQKRQQRILHEREVNRLVVDIDLVGRQIDLHVVDRDDV